MSPKTFEFSLTHYQQISLILINFLKDPQLVQYFIPFLKNGELEDSRLFHINNNPYKYCIKHNNPYLQHIHYFRKGLLRKINFGNIFNPLTTPSKCLTVSENILYIRLLFDNSEESEYFRQYIPACFPIKECVSSFLKSTHTKLEENIIYPQIHIMGNGIGKPPPHITVGHDISTSRPKIEMVYI